MYKKYTLQTEWYHAKITKTEIQENQLGICFTIDVGKEAYRHVWYWVDLDDFHLERLRKLFEEVGYIIVVETDNPLFTTQFINLRFKIHVTRRVKGTFIVNEILELKMPEIEPDYNVAKEKENNHYFENSKKRKLPIL